MPKPKKFTFKKHKKEGQYQSFERDNTDIKLNKKEVGLISEVGFDKYRISFAIKKEKTEQDPAPFKWIRLKACFKTEAAARAFVNEHAAGIQEKFDLHFFLMIK